MDPQKLFEQVRDLYDQLAHPLTKEQAAHFLGLIAEDTETKATTIQNEIDNEAEAVFDDDIEDINGESELGNDDDEEDN